MWSVTIWNKGRMFDIVKAEWIKGNVYPDGTNLLELGLSGAKMTFQLDLKIFSFDIEEITPFGIWS